MFCTFHSFCYSLISGNSEVAHCLGYYKGIPQIADDITLRKIHTMCRQQCSIKISDDKLNGKSQTTKSEDFQKEIYWKQFNKLLKEQNLITFDRICYGVCSLFTSDNPIVDEYKKKYQYIFVDEFQDTDPRQWEFVSSFRESNLFVVGDTKQAIYSFRGADSSIIKSLAENPEWTTIKLSENYRSTNEICDFSNQIHRSWKGSAYNLDILSNKHGIRVIEHSALNLRSNREILDIVSDSADGKTVAVLCRTNYEVSDIKDRLKSLGISFNSKDNNVDIGSVLKSAVDSEYLVDWLSNKLRSNDYNNYLKYCSIDNRYKTEAGFIELYQNVLEKYLKPIMQIREILQNEGFAYGKISEISKLLKIPKGVVNLSSDDDKGVIEYLIQLADSLSEETGIYVGTIHSVKGLEYDCVHLVGVNGKESGYEF